jgi:hypothetical protein
MRHHQAVHGQRRAGLPDEQRARHGRAGGAATTAARHASRAAGLLPGVLFFRPVVHLVRAQVSSTTTLFDMATIATQKRMNVEMNALQVKSDWHTRQVAHVSSFVTL